MTSIPDVTVEIAFDSGYSTPAASRTWTDVSDYVELADKINIGHGRGDEFTTADANSLVLALDNKDGRFTAERAASPYYPNVKIGRPIRVIATPVGGVASTRFLGYVDEWPVEWAETDAYAKATITAHSRKARLGFDDLRPTIAAEYALAEPAVYFKLDESDGSAVAVDTMGNLPDVVGTGMVFGLPGPPTESGTGASGSATIPGLPYSSADPDGFVLEFFLHQTGPDSDVITLDDTTTGDSFVITQLGASGVQVTHLAAGSVGPVFVVCDPTHNATHVAVQIKYIGGGNTTLQVWVNGVPAPLNTGTSPICLVDKIVISAQATISHLAFNASTDNILDRARAGYGMSGSLFTPDELAGDAIIRYASYAGIDPSEVDASPGHPVEALILADRTMVDVMGDIETTEGGILFDARDNTLTFRSRDDRTGVPSAFTLDAELQQIEAGVTPKLDRSTLVNDVTGTSWDGTTVRAVNAVSKDEYGAARKSIDMATDADTTLHAAEWLVNIFGEPHSRIPALAVNVVALDPLGLQTDILNADIGTRFTADNMPDQAPRPTLDVFIEGYNEVIGRGTYDIVFNASPAEDFDVWILEDPTYGAYDTYPLSY